SMAAEDFSFMLNVRPGAYFRIGQGGADGACLLHSTHYGFNDQIRPLGAALFARPGGQSMPLGPAAWTRTWLAHAPHNSPTRRPTMNRTPARTAAPKFRRIAFAIAASVALGAAVGTMTAGTAHAKTFRIADQGDALSMDPHSLNESLQLSITG